MLFWLSDGVCDYPVVINSLEKSPPTPRLQTPPAVINDMLSWQAFEVRGLQRGAEGVTGVYVSLCVCVCVCVCDREVEWYWWCVAMGHKAVKRGRQSSPELQAFFWGGVGWGGWQEQKPVWNSSRELEWLDGRWFTRTGHTQTQPTTFFPPLIF